MPNCYSNDGQSLIIKKYVMKILKYVLIVFVIFLVISALLRVF
jgi:hypothetical protein